MYIQLFYSHNVASEYINLNLHTALQLHIELPSLLTNASSKKITLCYLLVCRSSKLHYYSQIVTFGGLHTHLPFASCINFILFHPYNVNKNYQCKMIHEDY